MEPSDLGRRIQDDAAAMMGWTERQVAATDEPMSSTAKIFAEIAAAMPAEVLPCPIIWEGGGPGFDPRHNLIRAAAWIVAEIERHDRATVAAR